MGRLLSAFVTALGFAVLLPGSLQEAKGTTLRAGSRLGDQPALGGQGVLTAARKSLKRFQKPSKSHLVQMQIKKSVTAHKAATASHLDDFKARLSPYVPFWLPQNYTDTLELSHKALVDRLAVWDQSDVEHIFKAGKKQKKIWDLAHVDLKDQKERSRLAHVECIREEERAVAHREKVCREYHEENKMLQKKGQEMKPTPAECEVKVEGTPEELCEHFGKDAPVPPRLGDVPIEQFKQELKIFKGLLAEMQDSFEELQDRAAKDETEMMTVRWNYDEFQRHFDKVQGGTDEARSFALAEVDRRFNETKKLIQNRQAGWDYESWWMWTRRLKLEKDASFACGGPDSKCKERKEKLLKEAEFDYVDLLSENLERTDDPAAAGDVEHGEKWNEYWSLPLLRLHMDALTFEDLDIKSGERSGHSWWGGTNLPGWGWDERRANDLDVTHQLESIMQAGERYTDFRYSNLLLHIGKQKAKICEMEIMPALHIAGMIASQPDIWPMREVQKEIMMLHQAMKGERQYLWEEQSRAFSMVPMLRAAIRDIDRPIDVLKECQKTSLKWWKCRKTARQLHDYMADTVIFLEEQKLHLLAARNMINGSLPGDSWIRMNRHISAIDEHVKTWDKRNDFYKKFKIDLNAAEKLARGDSKNSDLQNFQGKMLNVLTTMLAELEPKLHDIPAGSRFFQGNRSVEIVKLYDVMCDKTKYPFYGGGSHMASENRHAYHVMAAPDPWFLLGSNTSTGNTTSSIFATIPTIDKEPAESASHPGYSPAPVVLPNVAAADVKTQREQYARELIDQLRIEDWEKLGSSAATLGETGESMKMSQQGSEAWLPPNYTYTSDKGHERLRQRFSHSSPSDEKKAFKQGQKENDRWTFEQTQLKAELKRRHKMYDECVDFEQKKKDTKLTYFENCVKEESKKREEWKLTKDDCMKEENTKREEWKKVFDECTAAETKQRDEWKKELDECVKVEDALRAGWKKTLEECTKNETAANETRVKVCEEYMKNISAPAPAPAPCPEPVPAPGPAPAPMAPAPCPPPTTTTPPPPPPECNPTAEEQSGPEAICLAKEKENLAEICSEAEAEVSKAGEDKANVTNLVALACKPNASTGTLFPTVDVCQERQNITNARGCADAEENTTAQEAEGKRPGVDLVIHKACSPFEPPELPCGRRQNLTWERECDDNKKVVDNLTIAGKPVPKKVLHFSQCYAHDPVETGVCEARENLTNEVACNKSKDVVKERSAVWAPITLDLAIYSECFDNDPPEAPCELRAMLYNNRTCNASLNDTRDKFAAGEYNAIKPNVSECMKSFPPAHNPEDPPEVLCRQPPIPKLWINVTFEEELKEMRQLVQTLQLDLWEVKWRYHTEEKQTHEMREKYEAFQSKFDQSPDLATAKKDNFAELERRRAEAKELIKKRMSSFKLENDWLSMRTDALEESIPKHCNETDCSELPWRRTRRDKLMREAEQDELVYIDRTLKRTDSEDEMNEPWSIRLLHEQLDAIADEEEDVKSDEFKDSFWKGHSMPGWSWDERNDNFLAAADTMENVLEASQRYFNYRHATVLTHLNQRKAQLCELQLQPAMLVAGMVVDVPDLTLVDLIQTEGKLLHEAMMVERVYHWEEQSRVWSMMPLLHAAVRDLKRPDHVLEECHMTSLSWYKCRKSSFNLLDYIEDMQTHLEQDATPWRNLKVALQAKKDMQPEVQAELELYKPLAKEVEDHFMTFQNRLKLYRKRGTELMQAEALARGDGNGKALKLLKAKMSTLLEEVIVDMQPLLNEIPEASRKFQESMGTHLLNLMERKCKYVKELFYKGKDINATQNREVYAVLSGEELEGKASYWWDGDDYWDGNMTDIIKRLQYKYWLGNETGTMIKVESVGGNNQSTVGGKLVWNATNQPGWNSKEWTGKDWADGADEWKRKKDEDHGYQVIDFDALAKSCNHTTILGCMKARLLQQRASVLSKGFLQKAADAEENVRHQKTVEIVRLLKEPF